MSSLLITEIQERVAYLILNYTEKRNALCPALVEDMTAAILDFNTQQDIKVIVIKSAGKPFCAGADLHYLTQMRNFTIEENEKDSSLLRHLFDAIYLSPKLVISQVEGPALAGGCGLATLADLCIATPEASFGYTEVKIGFVPALVMVYLCEKVGGAVMADLLLTGRILSADEALKLHLVQRIVDTDLIAEYVNNLAVELCENTSSQAVSSIKTMLRAIPIMNRIEALDYAVKQNAKARGTKDCKKGMDAFLNKQKIKW
ncbi:MAG: methylglutaconyl-CoA hydratase [Flavobacteriales bacterium]|nr:enoyl-CoA hydratase/isomerase family protein [Flavobacteriaceae bacterium]PHX92979.1 MAG: methylglutaconyl-CoA hydratase [Flavobacteriales bacterium]